MRDPNRIVPMLELLGNIWKKHPDLRLTQLVMNLRGGDEYGTLYHMEDDELARAMKELYKK